MTIAGVAGGLIVGILLGYGFGNKSGYAQGDDTGYKRAQAEIRSLEQGAEKKATQEAARAANPFQAVNPLQAVDANPFQKAKKVLNPFE